jgi:predicted  nucleic acid-binding Zn-ribbon protein
MSDTQWQELDGEAGTVESKGRSYTELAEAIARSVSTLQQIVDDTNTTAKSMEKTRKLAGEVREDIEKARERYSYTGEALTTYGTALRAAQSEADPAAARLRTLRADLETAQATAQSAESGVDDLPKDASEADKNDATRAQTNANNAVSDIQGQITQAESEWNAGHDDKNTAARSAISKIEEVVSGNKVNDLEDSGWDKFTNVLKGVYKVFKIICDIAGILAIFLSWVPILGQILMVLAAIGAIISIIENIVKFARGEIGFGAMLLGVGLGVMGLFGGKAIGSIAKYAKARSVVNTAATMSSRASKVKFGNALLKSSRKTLAMTKGQRVTEVLKSPFIRSAGDKAVWGMTKNGLYKNAFKSWQGSKFPLPYKDGAARFALGNDDVVDMMKHFSQTGLVIDRATSNAQAIASVGTVFNQAANLGNNAAKLGTSIGGGDGWGGYSSGNSLATSGAGGSWGKITGAPNNVNNAANGLTDVFGHDGYVAGKW